MVKMGGLTVVHEELITRIYYAPRCSLAYLWKLVAFLGSLIIPLIICIVTQGLWKKTNTYLEQPRVEYAYKSFFLIADASNTDAYRFWSSYQELNDANSEHLVMPEIESQEIDRNNDGKADEVFITVSLHTQNQSSSVNTVFFYLLFNVQLDYRSVMNMELPVMGYLEHLQNAPHVSVFGHLRVKSVKPLPSYGYYDISERIPEPEDGTIIFGNDTEAADVDPSLVQILPIELLRENLYRNVSLQLDDQFTYWSPLQLDSSNDFTFNFHFKIDIQELSYRTSAMELLKWFWLQYFSIFVFSKLVFRGLSSFLYENQILPTLIYCNQKKHE